MRAGSPQGKQKDSQARPRGRPRVDHPLERVSTRVPVVAYDRLVRAANAREMSVAQLVRQILIVRLSDFPS